MGKYAPALAATTRAIRNSRAKKHPKNKEPRTDKAIKRTPYFSLKYSETLPQQKTSQDHTI